jgi:hypothetical protein
MFAHCKFNKDISNWDVSNLKNMDWMFNKSDCLSSLSNWKPYKLDLTKEAFDKCKLEIPYWANFEDKEERKKVIDSYLLKQNLKKELNNNNDLSKKIKL